MTRLSDDFVGGTDAPPISVAVIVSPGDQCRGASLEHFPEKWAPVFRRKCDKFKNPDRFPIQSNRKAI